MRSLLNNLKFFQRRRTRFLFFFFPFGFNDSNDEKSSTRRQNLFASCFENFLFFFFLFFFSSFLNNDSLTWRWLKREIISGCVLLRSSDDTQVKREMISGCVSFYFFVLLLLFFFERQSDDSGNDFRLPPFYFVTRILCTGSNSHRPPLQVARKGPRWESLHKTSSRRKRTLCVQNARRHRFMSEYGRIRVVGTVRSVDDPLINSKNTSHFTFFWLFLSIEKKKKSPLNERRRPFF